MGLEEFQVSDLASLPNQHICPLGGLSSQPVVQQFGEDCKAGLSETAAQPWAQLRGRAQAPWALCDLCSGTDILTW